LEHLLIGVLAGLAATPHCIGMCGGFSLHLARVANRQVVATRLFLVLLRPKLPAIRWPGSGFLEDHSARLLSGGSLLGTFLFGLAVGYLPCPLTALLLVAAAGEHSVTAGMAMLGGAGIGTMPGLFLTGFAGSLIRGRWRAVGTKVLGSLVILFGLLMLLRRLGVIPGAHGGACH
jgi:sulfite exporter TauE/SafE